MGAAPQASPAWFRFFDLLGPDGLDRLDELAAQLARQVQANGVTYNVYADANGPQRPWSLDLFPLIVTPESWQRIESGVLQRVRLLEAVMADVYGPQRLLQENLLPPALVHGHPGYLRALHGAKPVGGRHLHIAAFDLARDASGHWWVVSQRTQAPSGLGYLLENRLIISRLFPRPFSDLRVQRLAASYSALVESLRAACPRPADGDAPRIVLLTPGPYNETYFEHAFLARYLGLTLVEGGDLTVRGERLYLKTLTGLEPVHGILKRLDDEFLDPLELRADSRLGVPGLLQAIRAGHVLVANAPGSAFLESTALLGFLPALSRQLLGQELELPSVPTWWCGERAAMHAALPRLARSVIKPTYTGTGHAVLGRSLAAHDIDAWSARIADRPDDYTLQDWMPLSQMPTWKDHRQVPRSLLLRVFALAEPADGGALRWRVLPGGLTRLAGASEDIASMQRGGSSADTWVLTRGEVDATTLLHQGHPSGSIAAPRQRNVTSRAAENLFWMGRYSERTENTTRLAHLVLESLHGEEQGSQPLMAWLGRMATTNGLVLPGVPPPSQSRRVFERALIATLADEAHGHSVGFNLGAMQAAASKVRERLSLEQWNRIVQARQAFTRGCARFSHPDAYASVGAIRVLDDLLSDTAAMTGAQTDRMTRDNGWRLLSVGRHLERLAFLASALSDGFDTGAIFDEDGYDAMVALFDSTITFRGLYQQRHDIPALVDLLVLDAENPRSLRWVLQTLRGRLARLEGAPAFDEAGAAAARAEMAQSLAAVLPDPAAWSLQSLQSHASPSEVSPASWDLLAAVLRQCVDSALELSDDLATRYFTHTDEARESVGA